jgi:single-strand DNA-binding protein
MALEVQGKLVDVFETVQITDKFKKREFVIETEERGYQQYVKFQLNQDKCSLIDDHKIGDELKVAFNLSGKPYTRKTGEKDYITNIVAWKIDKMTAGAAPSPSNEPPVFNMDSLEASADDLPF